MGSNRQDFATLGLAFLSIFGGLGAAFYFLASTLSPGAMAVTLTLIVLFGAVVALPLLWFIGRLTSHRRDIPEARGVIDYQPATSYTSAKPTQIVDVMRFEDMGSPRPMLPKPKVANDLKLRTQAKTGEDIEVDLIKAARFAELPTPSRAEWTGKREVYGQAGAFFRAHGMLDTDTRGGFKWKPQYRDPGLRRDFVRQFADRDEDDDVDARPPGRMRARS